MRSLFLAIFAFITLTLVGCGKSSSDCAPAATNPATPVATPGQINLAAAPTGNDARAARAVRSTRATGPDFLVGDIGSTKTYLFLLKNSGGSSVTNLVLTSDNPAVSVTPSSIGILQPDSVGGLSPIIQVTVKHGSGMGGFGYAPLLTAGDLTFNVSVTGTTLGSPTSVTAAIGGTVKVASYQITRSTSTAVDQVQSLVHSDEPSGTSAQYTVTPGQTAQTAAGVLKYSSIVDEHLGTFADGGHQIKNLGNQALVVTTFDFQRNLDGSVILTLPLAQVSEMTVAPGATVDLPLVHFREEASAWFDGMGADGPTYRTGIMTYFKGVVRVWSDGVIFDTAVDMPSVNEDVSGFQLEDYQFTPSSAG